MEDKWWAPHSENIVNPNTLDPLVSSNVSEVPP